MEKTVLKLYNEKYKLKEIAKKTNLPLKQIRKICKDNDLDTRFYNKINQDVINSVEVFIRKGLKQSNISKILDISIHTIRDIVKKNNLQYKGKKETLYENKVIELFSKGYNKSKIVSTLNINYNTVNSIFSKYGLNKDTKKLKKEIIELYNKNYNIVAICKSLRVSYRFVVKTLNQNNCERRNKENTNKDFIDRTQGAVKELYNKGISIEQISKQLHLNELQVRHDINN